VLIGLHHTCAVAKEKLIPKPPNDDKRDPQQRFNDLAAKIFTVPKSEIDEREKQWRHKKRAKPR
jgi:hypothetical protein